jgi:hypothetical protein
LLKEELVMSSDFDETSELAANAKSDLGTRFACPCCGFLTLSQEPPGTYAICEVCFWEDDGVQFRDPDYRGGANKVSLTEARENFKVEAVSESRFKLKVRSPRDVELP